MTILAQQIDDLEKNEALVVTEGSFKNEHINDKPDSVIISIPNSFLVNLHCSSSVFNKIDFHHSEIYSSNFINVNFENINFNDSTI